MKKWVLSGEQKIVLENNPPSTLTPEKDVKVRIEEVLLGKFDLALFHGQAKTKYPMILGKYAVGVVSDVFNPETSPFQKMNRVVVEPFISCHQCANCKNDDEPNCLKMQELGYNADGLLVDFCDLPQTCLHKLPDSLNNTKALFVPYVAFCLNVIDSLKIEKGSHVAVYSSSKIGIIASELLKYYQCVPIFVSDNEDALKRAKELGIFYAFNPNTTDVEQEIVMATGGKLCDEVIYFANSRTSLKEVLNICAFHATICIGGYNTSSGSLNLSQITKKHLNITGIYNGCGNYPSAINLIATNKVSVNELIDRDVHFSTLDEELKLIQPEDIGYKSVRILVD